jgi:AcrR family transcriptional regulator
MNTAPGAASPAPRLRERNKHEKLRRIQKAAWELFSRNGFEATTTREVAEAAGVGTGTLFLYAKDKSDLLVLAFQDAVAGSLETAAQTVPAAQPVVERLMHVFGAFFRVFDRDRRLAREFVKELLVTGEPAREPMAAVTRRTLQVVGEQIDRARRAGELGDLAPVRDVALDCFALYYGSLALWLGGWLAGDDTPDAHLRRALATLAGRPPSAGPSGLQMAGVAGRVGAQVLPVVPARARPGTAVTPAVPPARWSPSRPAIFGKDDGDFID